MLLTDCEVSLTLTCSKNYVLTHMTTRAEGAQGSPISTENDNKLCIN